MRCSREGGLVAVSEGKMDPEDSTAAIEEIAATQVKAPQLDLEIGLGLCYSGGSATWRQ